MNEIQVTQAGRLRQLHGEITRGARMLLDKAIEAGGILHDVKASLPHGEFTPWVEVNAGFNLRTAQRYMKIHENREQLKSDSVSFLTDAHRMLTAPKEDRLNDAEQIAEWDIRLDAIKKKLAAFGNEWETIKANPQEVVGAFKRINCLVNEATSLTFEAERNLGRILNEFERDFPEAYRTMWVRRGMRTNEKAKVE